MPNIEEKMKYIILKMLMKYQQIWSVLEKDRNTFIQTYGCQANERDSETLAGIFRKFRI